MPHNHETYVLDYDLEINSGDEFEDIIENGSDISLSGSKELITHESSLASLWNKYTEEFDRPIARNGNIWSESFFT